MTPEAVIALVVAGIGALFGLLAWLVRRMWSFLETTLTKALDGIGGSLKAINETLAELTGQVTETRADVAELTPPPVDAREDVTPIQRPPRRPPSEYGHHKKRGDGG